MPEDEEPGIVFNIYVHNDAWKDDEAIREAVRLTLDDLCEGRLTLGGSAMRGHGIFSGTHTLTT
jgi:hypothetical protein